MMTEWWLSHDHLNKRSILSYLPQIRAGVNLELLLASWLWLWLWIWLWICTWRPAWAGSSRAGSEGPLMRLSWAGTEPGARARRRPRASAPCFPRHLSRPHARARPGPPTRAARSPGRPRHTVGTTDPHSCPNREVTHSKHSHTLAIRNFLSSAAGVPAHAHRRFLWDSSGTTTATAEPSHMTSTLRCLLVKHEESRDINILQSSHQFPWTKSSSFENVYAAASVKFVVFYSLVGLIFVFRG